VIKEGRDMEGDWVSSRKWKVQGLVKPCGEQKPEDKEYERKKRVCQ